MFGHLNDILGWKKAIETELDSHRPLADCIFLEHLVCSISHRALLARKLCNSNAILRQGATVVTNAIFPTLWRERETLYYFMHIKPGQ